MQRNIFVKTATYQEEKLNYWILHVKHSIMIAIILGEWFTENVALIWKLSDHRPSFLLRLVKWTSPDLCDLDNHWIVQQLDINWHDWFVQTPTAPHTVLGLSVSNQEGGLISLQNNIPPMYPAMYSINCICKRNLALVADKQFSYNQNYANIPKV